MAPRREADTQTMHMRTLVAVCLALALSAVRADAQLRPPNPAPGENFHVEFGAIFWTTTPTIIIGGSALAAAGGAGVDFVQEFNIENERFMELRAVLKGGKHKLRVSKVPINYQKSARLQRTIILNGQPFEVSADATADLSWDMWRIGYEYDFVAGDAGYVGFLTDVKYNHVIADLRVDSFAGSGVSLTDVTVTAPQIGVVARVYPHKSVSITAEYTGFKAPGWLRERFTDAETFEATFKDFDLYGTVSITRFIGLQIGYRSISVDYIVDDDFGDLQMKGPYFGGLVRF